MLLTRATLTLTSPLSVNLIALLNKLFSICFNLAGSPITKLGTFAAINRFNAKFFSTALAMKNEILSSNAVLRLNFIFSIVIFPASILEISRISLIKYNNISEAFFASFTNELWSSDNEVYSNNDNIPIIPLIGVLISCDIFAKKLLLAILAFSAFLFASCSAVSIRLRSIARSSELLKAFKIEYSISLHSRSYLHSSKPTNPQKISFTIIGNTTIDRIPCSSKIVFTSSSKSMVFP